MLLAFDWTQLAQQIVIGLSSGGVFATLAVALVLIYRSTGVVNFAQGEMAMFSTFIAWSLVHHGLSYWAAFFLTVAISFFGGVGIERVVIKPVERAPVLTVVIVTLGLFFLVNGAARWIWSPEVRSLPNAFSTRPIDVAGVAFSIQDLGTIAVSLGAVGLLWLFFRFTKLGLASRAAAVNPEASRLVGVRVSWMLALGWGLAAAMGAVSGMLTAPALASFDQNLMQPVLLYAFAGAVLGGLDSPLGAVALLWVFFRFTKLGLASRAAAVDPDATRLVGVRVSWLLALGWGLAAAMGAVSGMLTAPALASFDQNLMQPVLLYAFAGAVLGGLDSPLGAVVGSLLLGVLINLIGTYVDWVGTELRLPVALAVILGVLLVRPTGLFGRAPVTRV